MAPLTPTNSLRFLVLQSVADPETTGEVEATNNHDVRLGKFTRLLQVPSVTVALTLH